MAVTAALGMLESTGYTSSIAALDVMEKTSGIQVLQTEINDYLGICTKITGAPDAVSAALHAGKKIAANLGGKPISDIIRRPDREAWKAIESPPEFNPLMQQHMVHRPAVQTAETTKENSVTKPDSYALGFIETQGFTAVFEAIDTACKAANVEVIGKEKLGGGYVTVVIKGDVAAVNAAVEAGQKKVGELGNLIAAHVIPRPGPNVLSLLPGS